MAADSDGINCEENLPDIESPKKVRTVVGKLKNILQQPKATKMKINNKSDMWNNVRVTLSIPRDAAQKLRQLASVGNSDLAGLGILSVQIEEESVITLRIDGKEVILSTEDSSINRDCRQSTSDAGKDFEQKSISRSFFCQNTSTVSGSTNTCIESLSETTKPKINVTQSLENTSKMDANISLLTVTQQNSNSIDNEWQKNVDNCLIFKSPNTICPMNEKLPAPPIANSSEIREYPFESMTQARVIQRRENSLSILSHNIKKNQLLPEEVRNCSSVEIIEDKHKSQQYLSNKYLSSKEFITPPPPYSKPTIKVHKNNPQLGNLSNNNISISSPLLVNLLQNDVSTHPKNNVTNQQIVNAKNGKTNLNDLIDIKKENIVSTTGEKETDRKSSIYASADNTKINHTLTSVPSCHINLQNIDEHSFNTAQLINNAQISKNAFEGSINTIPNNINDVFFSQLSSENHPQSGNIQTLRSPMQHKLTVGSTPQTNPKFSVTNISNMNKMSTSNATISNLKQLQDLKSNNQLTRTQTKFFSTEDGTYNIPSWPFKPMDSVTKSSFQEFTRYQMQYNLQQEIIQKHQLLDDGIQSNEDSKIIAESKKNNESISPGVLYDLEEFTKNDLDALLPTINCDLDAALSAEDKNALESLLQDANDLDLDLIDPALPSTIIDDMEDLQNDPLQPFVGSRSEMTKTNQSNVHLNISKKSCAPNMYINSSNLMLINPLTGEMESMSKEDNKEEKKSNVNSYGLKYSNYSNRNEENSFSTIYSTTSELIGTEKSKNGSMINLKQKNSSGVVLKSNRKTKQNNRNCSISDGLLNDNKDKVRVKIPKDRKLKSSSNLLNTSSDKLKLKLKLEKTPQSHEVNANATEQKLQNEMNIKLPSSPLNNTSTTLTNKISSTDMESDVLFETSPSIANCNMMSSNISEDAPRVPPLHISLRGKNSIIIKNTKKDRKKSQIDTDDEDVSKNKLRRQNTIEVAECKTINIGEKFNDTAFTERNINNIKAVTLNRVNENVDKILEKIPPKTEPVISTSTAFLLPNKTQTDEVSVPSERIINDEIIGKANSIVNCIPNIKNKDIKVANALSTRRNEIHNIKISPNCSMEIKTSCATLFEIEASNYNTNKQKLILKNQPNQSAVKYIENADDIFLIPFDTTPNKSKDFFQSNETDPDLKKLSISEKSCTKNLEGDLQNLERKNNPLEEELKNCKMKLMCNNDIPTVVTNSILSMNLKNSPSSHVQGDDSGIESMDALSEKSPQQTTSSPQGEVTHKKLSSKMAPSCQSKIIGDNVIQEHEKNSTDIDIPVKVNDSMNESPITKIIDGNDCNYMLKHDMKVNHCVTPKKEYKQSTELHQNSIQYKELESQIKKSSVNSAKMIPIIKLKDIGDTNIYNVSKVVDVEQNLTESENGLYISKEESHEKLMTVKSSDDITFFSPISIEIPTQVDMDSPRIRTRASSKLESPLETKNIQSPKINSPSFSQKNKIQSTSIAERISPKLPCTLKSNSTVCDNSLGSTMKRKYEETIDEEKKFITDNIYRKRGRSNSCSTGFAAEETNSSMKTVDDNDIGSKKKDESSEFNDIGKKKREESSDSDEPLIEVAGKVRSTKCIKHDFSDKSHRFNRAGQSISSTAKGASIPSNVMSDEKINTRRSVRASGGQIRVTSNKGSPPENKQSTKFGIVSEFLDLRRKTRSTVSGDSPISEVRRRRPSKDSK